MQEYLEFWTINSFSISRQHEGIIFLQPKSKIIFYTQSKFLFIFSEHLIYFKNVYYNYFSH